MRKWLVRLYDALPRSLSSVVVRAVKPTHIIGIVAVVFNDNGQVLALRHTYHKPAWRLPGGIKERRESPEETTVREVYEEARCVVEPVHVVTARQLPFSFDVVMLSRLLNEQPFAPNEETCERRWLKEDELPLLSVSQQEFVQAARKVWQWIQT